jgi:hypothetical protein
MSLTSGSEAAVPREHTASTSPSQSATALHSSLHKTRYTEQQKKTIHVGFHDPPITLISRSLTYIETWSLFYFEEHARTCKSCWRPNLIFDRGEKLCEAGRELAVDVAHLPLELDDDGVVFAKSATAPLEMRVEFPADYRNAMGLLQVIDKDGAKGDFLTPPPGHKTKKFGSSRGKNAWLYDDGKSSKAEKKECKSTIRGDEKHPNPQKSGKLLGKYARAFGIRTKKFTETESISVIEGEEISAGEQSDSGKGSSTKKDSASTAKRPSTPPPSSKARDALPLSLPSMAVATAK